MYEVLDKDTVKLKSCHICGSQNAVMLQKVTCLRSFSAFFTS